MVQVQLDDGPLLEFHIEYTNESSMVIQMQCGDSTLRGTISLDNVYKSKKMKNVKEIEDKYFRNPTQSKFFLTRISDKESAFQISKFLGDRKMDLFEKLPKFLLVVPQVVVPEPSITSSSITSSPITSSQELTMYQVKLADGKLALCEMKTTENEMDITIINGNVFLQGSISMSNVSNGLTKINDIIKLKEYYFEKPDQNLRYSLTEESPSSRFEFQITKMTPGGTNFNIFTTPPVLEVKSDPKIARSILIPLYQNYSSAHGQIEKQSAEIKKLKEANSILEQSTKEGISSAELLKEDLGNQFLVLLNSVKDENARLKKELEMTRKQIVDEVNSDVSNSNSDEDEETKVPLLPEATNQKRKKEKTAAPPSKKAKSQKSSLRIIKKQDDEETQERKVDEEFKKAEDEIKVAEKSNDVEKSDSEPNIVDEPKKEFFNLDADSDSSEDLFA